VTILPSCNQEDDTSLILLAHHAYAHVEGTTIRLHVTCSRCLRVHPAIATVRLHPYTPRSRGRPHAGGAMRGLDLSFRPSVLHHKPISPEPRLPHFRFIRPWIRSLTIAMRQRSLRKITQKISLSYLATTRFHQAQAPRQIQEPVSVVRSHPHRHTPHHRQSPHPAQVCSLDAAGIV
jgi:hypothetical protein